MKAERRDGPWPRLVWGVILLSAGILFWLDRLGRIEARDYLEWWPLALIAAGLAQLPQRRWMAAAVWLAIGAFFLLPMLGIPQMQFWRVIGLWPLLISVAGGFVVAQALRRPGKERRGGTFRSVAVMGANERVVRTPGLAGGEAMAVMAGCMIDLALSRNAPDEIVIDALAFWGGIDIRIPPGWNVVNQASAILAGFEDKTGPGEPNKPRVVIRGAAIMGGIEVKNSSEPPA